MHVAHFPFQANLEESAHDCINSRTIDDKDQKLKKGKKIRTSPSVRLPPRKKWATVAAKKEYYRRALQVVQEISEKDRDRSEDNLNRSLALFFKKTLEVYDNLFK